MRIIENMPIFGSFSLGISETQIVSRRKKSYYSTVQKIICPSCGASVELTGQQVVCEYCGAVIRSEFYDWQTERFEVYERIGTNLRRALLLTGAMGIVYVCVFFVPVYD